MGVLSVVKRLGVVIRRIPPVEGLLKRRYEVYFRTSPATTCRGVYGSFAEAAASAPTQALVGCDNPGYAAVPPTPLDSVNPRDYPLLFWLARNLREGTRLFDLGGHVGVKFHAFRKYLEYPAGLTWTVCDLPLVVREGERLARERGATGIRFTTDIEEGTGSDVLLAAGSLQYIERPFAETLAGYAAAPRHLLLNGLPLKDGPTVVTLQSIGAGGFAPYWLFNDVELVASLERIGYRVVDRWRNVEKGCTVPYYPQHSVKSYTGLYLRRD